MSNDFKTFDDWDSLLNEILIDAENLFGNRVSSNPPTLEFSETKGPVTYKDLIILPSYLESGEGSIPQAIFQLSHEIIHLLSYEGDYSKPNVLEEGLACFFFMYSSSKRGINWLNYIDKPNAKYKTALDLYSQLDKTYPGIIKEIRKAQPKISSILSEDLVKHGVPIDLATDLTTPFYK